MIGTTLEHFGQTPGEKPGAVLKWRELVNGDRISGHGREDVGYPELIVKTAPEKGSMLFTIESFHWADVRIDGDKTTLTFEGLVPVTLEGAHVQYYWYEMEPSTTV